MISDVSIDQVMARLRDGDQEAASLIFHRFVHRLTALASRQFDARFRSKADPEDVVQSVYRSFFLHDGHSPFDLPDWDSLWSLLATITIRKCTDRRTYWMAARRSLARELPRSPEAAATLWWEALDRGPTPLQATVLTEILETILRDLPAKYRPIAELSLQGFTAPEIAARCHCSERTVGRVVARIKDSLEAINADDRAA